MILFYMYLAGVVEFLQATFVLAPIFWTLGLVFLYAFKDDHDALYNFKGFSLYKWAIIVMCCFTIAIFIPSKQVLYTAAVMEAGDSLLDTDLGKKVYQVLEYQLDELTEDK